MGDFTIDKEDDDYVFQLLIDTIPMTGNPEPHHTLLYADEESIYCRGLNDQNRIDNKPVIEKVKRRCHDLVVFMQNTLWKNGVTHGDATGDNIVWDPKPKPGTNSLCLIDWERMQYHADASRLTFFICIDLINVGMAFEQNYPANFGSALHENMEAEGCVNTILEAETAVSEGGAPPPLKVIREATDLAISVVTVAGGGAGSAGGGRRRTYSRRHRNAKKRTRRNY